MVRPARPSDLPEIAALIRALADYEKLAHEVVFDTAELGRHLFGERPHAEVLIAEEAARPVGFALFFHNFSTFLGKPGLYLEDLFVRPEHRGRGHGKALFLHLAHLAEERGCGRLDWSVLDWNSPAISFYRSLGAVALDDWTGFRLTGEPLRRAAGTVRR